MRAKRFLVSHYSIALPSVLFAASCIGTFNSDFSAPTAGGYSLIRTSANQVMIVPADGWSDKTPIIPAKVVECDFDARFIIAKRQGLRRRSPESATDTYEVPDPDIEDFWILDTSGPYVFGPLSESEFTARREAMEIPRSLTLKPVNSFRH